MNLIKLLLPVLVLLPLGQGLAAQEDYALPPLTPQEECAVTFMTLLNTAMGGLSQNSDAQMRRLAMEADAQMRDEQFKQALTERCGADGPYIGKLPADRQNAVVGIATCRYRDMLAAEYERDGLAMPQSWAALPVDCQDIERLFGRSR